MRKPHVVILGDLNLPQCKKYRVMQKLEALSRAGISVDYAHWEDTYRAMSIMQLATFVIFYRCRDTAAFDVLLRESRRLRIANAYDIDDPIFSEAIYAENTNLAHLDLIERKGLLASADSHLSALRRCDAVIVSTPRLVDEVKRLSATDVWLWRNAVDAETVQAVDLAQGLTRTKLQSAGERPLRIVYASGSRAHEADFRILQKPLMRFLEAHPQVEFHIIGYLELPAAFEALGARVVVTPFSDYAAYVAKLAECDIAVVPLVPDSFNDCKSAIRFMEAALVHTVCIATGIGDFRAVLRNGETGCLASTEDDWTEALERLAADTALRRHMAAQACASVTAGLGADAVLDGLPETLKDKLHAR